MPSLFTTRLLASAHHWSVHPLEVDESTRDGVPVLVFDASSDEYHAVLSRGQVVALYEAIGAWLDRTRTGEEPG